MAKRLKFILTCIFVIGCLSFFILYLSSPNRPGNTEKVAARLEKILSGRTSALEKKANAALYGNWQEWISPKDVREDENIYRYVGGELQDWTGYFSVMSDDISESNILQIISGDGLCNLSSISDTLKLYNFGPRWYLAAKMEREDVCVIYGLTLIDSYNSGSINGINPRLNLPDKYLIRPLQSEEGSIVSVGGIPQFKIVQEAVDADANANSVLLWMSFCCFIIVLVLLATGNKSFDKLCLLIGALLTSSLAMWVYGRSETNDFSLFSPTLFAGGDFFYSIGSLLLVNSMITIACLILYLSRKALYPKFTSTKSIKIATLAAFILFCAGLWYVHISFKSIIINSGICLELYKIQELSSFSAIIYCSYLLLVTSLPLLMAMVSEAVEKLFPEKRLPSFNIFRIIYPSALAIYFVCAGAILGFKKEQSMLEIWADRLSMDRDIAVEMSLRRVEAEIAKDSVIASLAIVPNGEKEIEDRLTEHYFQRLSKAYNFIVERNPRNVSSIISNERIAQGSHFFYLYNDGAYPCYGAIFFYDIPSAGAYSILIKAEPVSGRRTKGYASLLGIAPPGRIVIPAAYSYSRYQNRKLVAFRGDFPYKTTLNEDLLSKISNNKLPCIKSEGSTIFIYRVSDDETVLISRSSISFVNYVIASILLAIILFLIISLYSRFKAPQKFLPRSYFKERITWTLMLSLFLTLITLCIVSVVFVYGKNEDNMRMILSDKINSTQSLLESRIHDVEQTGNLSSPEMAELLDRVAESSNSDINLFTPDGQLLMSTSQFLFDNYALPKRINGTAFKNIMRENRRLYFQKENIGQKKYYQMYAPLLAANGKTLAIISTPYTDESYDFEKDAISHLSTIVIVFMLLLILSRFIIQAVADKMFGPLGEMSLKMSTGGLDSFEYINYGRNDEIANIVNAYNRMVAKLYESSKELAAAERNKAWNEMARQVAHEIKNPLTPMKLQIQRLIRLKINNAPDWQDKFDEIAAVILDHIDILSDTANEFSSFAKLYSEPHTRINLSDVIQEEISMFDNNKDVKFEFLGLKDTIIFGPKPQLTRVFVNLLGNAVQALEGRKDGEVMVSLRKSTKDSYLDIVFEDNGPGVDEDKVSKLFTPNFTTKNGGSGLGLAISRSILETCGASIAYSRSFTLGGACFTIQYPVDQTR